MRVYSFELIVHRKFKKTTDYRLQTKDWCHWRLGFGLFELMVVVTIIGITISVITASFLTFERNQRVKSAASTMKNEIRLAQSKALSGDKGPGLAVCQENYTLVGWYVNITKSDTNFFYTASGDCNNPSTGEFQFLGKIVNLPKGVKINNVYYNGASYNSANILFRPLEQNVLFFNAEVGLQPPLMDDSNKLFGASMNQYSLTIELKNIQDNNTYKVIIQPSGEVNESKP